MAYHINPDGTRTRVKDNLYYKTGLDRDTRNNINEQIKRVKKGKPTIIIIDGGLGSGKTNTAITIARNIQGDFDFQKQVGRGIDQFSKAWKATQEMNSDSEVRACVFDEAHTYNKRGFMTALNKELNNFFMNFRHKNTILIFALPHFAVLDSAVFDTLAVRGLIHMEEDAHPRYRDISSFDGISVEDMLDHIDRYAHRGKRRVRRECYRKVFSTKGHIRLPIDYKSIEKSSNKGKDLLLDNSISALSGK